MSAGLVCFCLAFGRQLKCVVVCWSNVFVVVYNSSSLFLYTSLAPSPLLSVRGAHEYTSRRPIIAVFAVASLDG